jgi:hypothetical protein
MAGHMEAPIGLIELALMGAMYRNRKLNMIGVSGASALAVF